MAINLFEPLQFTALMGPEGKQWSETSSPWSYLFQDCNEAVRLMRLQRLDEGQALLDRVAADLPEVDEPLLRRVLDRFHLGSLGYYAYLINDFAWAHAAMEAGCQAVADAVDQAAFLMPFAHHCKELVIHRARIDRNRQCWQGMMQFIDLAQAMNESSAPLCTLSDGTEITYRSLEIFFGGLDSFSESEQQQIDEFLDQDFRNRSHELFTRKFMDPQGFIIHAA